MCYSLLDESVGVILVKDMATKAEGAPICFFLCGGKDQLGRLDRLMCYEMLLCMIRLYIVLY